MASLQYLYIKFSEDVRLRSLKTIDDDGKSFKWPEIYEILVKKESLDKMFFKTSHLGEYRTITLKRQLVPSMPLFKLNNGPKPISLVKYQDLLSLCSGDKPVIKSPEDLLFFKSLRQLTE